MIAVMSENLTWFKLTYTVKSPCILREFLQEQGISRRALTAIKYNGGKLLVNNEEQNVRFPLKQHDSVVVIFPEEKRSVGLHPENGDLSIVYEDDYILVVAKDAGQATIPSRNQPDGTIANFVAGKFERQGVPATVHVVTRLDRDTSGLICIAKNRHIHHVLSEQLQHQSFHREYVAFIEGTLKSTSMTICEPIGRKDGSIIERTVREDGQTAITHVECQQVYKDEKGIFSKIQLQLETGRTHQIRVHMQWLGCPLIGDDLYGGSTTRVNRQALHCHRLAFSHPITSKPLHFEAALPYDLRQLIDNSTVFQ